MKLVAQFDPTAAQFNPPGTSPPSGNPPAGTVNLGNRPGDGKFLVFNQSLINLVLTFPATGFVDYVPAGTYRYFEMSLPVWVINWSGIPGSTVAVLGLQSPISNETSLVTFVVYEPSEAVPTIEPATSFVNPFDTQLFVGPDNQSTTFSGTAASLFTLSSGTFPGTTTFLSHIIVSAIQTAASGDHADLNITITNISNFGGSPKYIIHFNNLNNNTYPIPFNPPLPALTTGTAINVVGTLTNVVGAGISVTSAISAYFYHV